MKYIVVLAAYGYSKYLDCQIKSIDIAFRQADVVGEVYISFDGDFAEHKVKKLAIRVYRNITITILKGPNAGVNANFLYLSKHVTSKNYDNYSCFFSDHDDIWHEEKVKSYIRLMKECKDDDFLIFSNSSLFMDSCQLNKDLWSELNYSGQVLRPAKLIIKNYVQGATICASDKILKKYVKLEEDQIMFDHLLAYIASLRNCLIPVNSMMIGYRIHGDNLIGIQKRQKLSLGKLKYFLYRYIYFLYLYVRITNINEIK